MRTCGHHDMIQHRIQLHTLNIDALIFLALTVSVSVIHTLSQPFNHPSIILQHTIPSIKKRHTLQVIKANLLSSCPHKRFNNPHEELAPNSPIFLQVWAIMLSLSTYTCHPCAPWERLAVPKVESRSAELRGPSNEAPWLTCTRQPCASWVLLAAPQVPSKLECPHVKIHSSVKAPSP